MLQVSVPGSVRRFLPAKHSVRASSDQPLSISYNMLPALMCGVWAQCILRVEPKVRANPCAVILRL